MKATQLLPLALALTSSLALAQDAEKHKLGIFAPKGTKAHFTVHTKTSQDIDMGAQQMTMGHDVERGFSLEVADVDKDGKLKLTVVWESWKGKMLMPMGGEVEFDTTKPAPEGDEAEGMGMPTSGMVHGFVSTTLGKPLTATVSVHGNDLEIAGLKELTEGAAKKAPGMAGSMLMGLLNEGLLKKDVECALGRYPTEPIAVGGTWKTAIQEAGRRNRPAMRTEGTHRLENATKDELKISFQGTLVKDEPKEEPKKEGEEKVDPQVAAAREQMKNLKISDGKTQGTCRIARADCLALETMFTMSAQLTLPNPMGGDGEMKIDQKATVTCKRATAKSEEKPKGEAKPQDGKTDKE